MSYYTINCRSETIVYDGGTTRNTVVFVFDCNDIGSFAHRSFIRNGLHGLGNVIVPAGNLIHTYFIGPTHIAGHTRYLDFTIGQAFAGSILTSTGDGNWIRLRNFNLCGLFTTIGINNRNGVGARSQVGERLCGTITGLVGFSRHANLVICRTRSWSNHNLSILCTVAYHIGGGDCEIYAGCGCDRTGCCFATLTIRAIGYGYGIIARH